MSEFSRLRQEAGLTIPDAVEALGYCERTLYRWENGEGAPRKAALEILRKTVAGKPRSSSAFTFIDLFAGIGVFVRALTPSADAVSLRPNGTSTALKPTLPTMGNSARDQSCTIGIAIVALVARHLGCRWQTR